MDNVEFILKFVIAMLIFCLIFTVGLCVIENVYGYELETQTYECVITYKDMDQGQYFISVVSNGSDFAETIKVSSNDYARYLIGECYMVTQNGYHSPLSGDSFEYTITK